MSTSMSIRSPAARSNEVAQGQIPSLDGIRALSFLLVFLGHAGLGDIVPGQFGVTVFFFLSGYLITTLLRLEHEQRGTISLRDFYLRRLLRIFPPFYTAIVGALILTWVVWGASNPGLAAAPFFAQALHVTNYWAIAHTERYLPPGTIVFWSLAVEEHFYLLFPALFLLLHRQMRLPAARVAILISICLAVLVWRIVLIQGYGTPWQRTYMGTDTRLDSILWGCVLAICGNPILDDSTFNDRTWTWILLPLGLVALLGTFVYRDATFRETWRYSIQAVALIPVFVVAIKRPSLGPFALLSWEPLKQIGVLSYSLYLIHYTILGTTWKLAPGHPILSGVLAFVVSVALAMLMNRAIEKPCARLRRRLAHAVVRTTSS
jgi:peptidoglycan/LPS O-acetylase OafA/YrhL